MSKLSAYRTIKQIFARYPQLVDPNLRPYVGRQSTRQYWINQLARFQALEQQLDQQNPNVLRNANYIGFDNDLYTGIVTIYLELVHDDYPDESRERKLTVRVDNYTLDEVNAAIQVQYENYTSNFDEHFDVTIDRLVFNPQAVGGGSDRCGDKTFFKYPCDLQCNYTKIANHCFLDLLQSFVQRKYDVKRIYNRCLKQKEWTGAQVINALKSTKSMRIYIHNLTGKVIESINDKAGGKPVRLLMGNNHIAEINKDEVNMLKQNWYMQLQHPITDVKQAKMLNNDDIVKIAHNHKIIPINVNHTDKTKNDIFLTKYIIDNTLYVPEDDYNAYLLYKKIGLFEQDQFKLTWRFDKLYPFKIMTKTIDNINSIGNQDMTKPRAMLVNNFNKYCRKKLRGIDVCKAYSSTIAKLKYIPVQDVSTPWVPYDGSPVNMKYFYKIASIPDKLKGRVYPGVCTGKRIIDYADDLDIQFMMKPKYVKNPFSELVDKMLKIDQNASKPIINKFYGCMFFNMNTVGEISSPKCFISGENEAAELKSIKVGEELFLNYHTFTIRKEHNPNLLPFAHMIVDTVAKRVNDKIKELVNKGVLKNLIAICTDSIRYYGKVLKIKGSTPGYWRMDNSNLEEQNINYVLDAPINEKLTMLETVDQVIEAVIQRHNVLIDSPAGHGKTFLTSNILLPKFKELGLKVAMICSHAQPLMCYYDYDLCDIYTITSFMKKYDGRTHEYDVILNDEYGLNNTNQCMQLCKNDMFDVSLVCIGDTRQLWAVETFRPKYNVNESSAFLNMFKFGFGLFENRRNNYTREDYINMCCGTYVFTEFEKCKISKNNELITPTMICYTNEKRIALNKLMVDKLGWTKKIDNKLIAVGGRFICRPDIEHRHILKKMRICNKMRVTVKSFDDKYIHFTNGRTIPVSLFKQFDYGYALTLYGIQGMSVPYDEISFHEIGIIKSQKGGLYTAFSRIKTK